MSVFTYIFPLIVIGAIGFYYVRIYQKGKASGGGMMAGFQAAAHERWGGLIGPGETIAAYGSGVLWRPYWQALLASQVPALRLVWPTVVYEMVVTNSGRVLMGESGMLGLKGGRAYDRGSVRFDRVVEEKPGLAMKINPLYQMFGKDHKTFEAVMLLPEGQRRLYSVPGTFLAALQG
jgi:hypothetical protein